MKLKVQPKGKITSKPERIVFNPFHEVLFEQLGSIKKSRCGKYAHYCYDWDELLIDEYDEEFKVCTCGKPNAKT